MKTQIRSRASIDRCNEILRGEISAVETYVIAIRRFPEEPSISTLRSIRDGHAASVEQLCENIVRMGGQPTIESGAWGEFAKAVEEAASLLGAGAAVEALRQGEQHGVRQYEEAIEDEGTDKDSRLLYSEILLPRLLTHLTWLEVLS